MERMTKKISELKQGEKCVIAELKGETRFMNRIVAIGLTPGCHVEIVKNQKNRPLLIYSRDTMIALNSKECENIFVQGE